MDKVTEVNIEGKDYGFVAGQTVKGVSGALSADYVKHVILPEGAEVVEGMLIAVTFVNENTAGYAGEKTVYSTDGINFYWDSGYTQLITLPPQGCYTVYATETQYEYKLSEYPVLSVNGVTAPFCDSKGHPYGGAAWSAGDSVTMLYMGDKFVAILSTINQVVAGVDIPPTSDAVFQAIAANNTAKGLVGTKADNAIARFDGTDGKLQDSGVTIDDSNVISGGTLNNKANESIARSGYVTCSTAAGTAAKTVSLTGFTLNKGARLVVYLQNANTAASALTLNVNGTGAKTIIWNGSTTSSTTYAMTATYYNCYYDGTYWRMDSSYEAYNARNASVAIQADYTRGNAYCTTAAATAAKVASMRGYVLRAGACFPITFTDSNSANSMTLNVNSTGAKSVYLNGKAVSSSNKTLNSGTYLCLYDGTVYHIGFSGASTAGTYGGLLKANKWSWGTSSGYIKFSNGLIMQWLKEYETNDGDNWITLPIAMTSLNYIIVDGRKGSNLADTTGWTAKEKGRFCVNPKNAHTTDFLIMGY